MFSNFIRIISKVPKSGCTPSIYCNQKLLQNVKQYEISPCFSRNFSSKDNSSDATFSKLHKTKYIFGAVLFSISFGSIYYFTQKKAAKRKKIYEGCQHIPIDQSLFDAKIELYKYKGYVFPDDILRSGIIKELDNFSIRNDDVIVASFPKTGTTWLQEIVYMLTHDLKVSEDSDGVLETRFPYLEYEYPGLKTIEDMKHQRCIKTHLPYSLLPPSFDNSEAKLIYITRNPRDTAISYYHFMRLLTESGYKGSIEKFLDFFLNDEVGYAPFIDHIKGYWDKKEKSNVLFLTYEQLQKDPSGMIRKIADFLQIPVSDDDIKFVTYHTSFQSMSKNPAVNYEHWKDFGFAYKDKGSFMRKGKIGAWKEEMSEEYIKKFEEWEKQKSKDIDIVFEFT